MKNMFGENRFVFDKLTGGEGTAPSEGRAPLHTAAEEEVGAVDSTAMVESFEKDSQALMQKFAELGAKMKDLSPEQLVAELKSLSDEADAYIGAIDTMGVEIPELVKVRHDLEAVKSALAEFEAVQARTDLKEELNVEVATKNALFDFLATFVSAKGMEVPASADGVGFSKVEGKLEERVGQFLVMKFLSQNLASPEALKELKEKTGERAKIGKAFVTEVMAQLKAKYKPADGNKSFTVTCDESTGKLDVVLSTDEPGQAVEAKAMTAEQVAQQKQLNDLDDLTPVLQFLAGFGLIEKNKDGTINKQKALSNPLVQVLGWFFDSKNIGGFLGPVVSFISTKRPELGKKLMDSKAVWRSSIEEFAGMKPDEVAFDGATGLLAMLKEGWNKALVLSEGKTVNPGESYLLTIPPGQSVILAEGSRSRSTIRDKDTKRLVQLDAGEPLGAYTKTRQVLVDAGTKFARGTRFGAGVRLAVYTPPVAGTDNAEAVPAAPSA